MNLNETFQAVRLASRKLALTDEQTVNNILLAVADEALLRTDEILEANLADLERMDPSNPKYDRLKLTFGWYRPGYAERSFFTFSARTGTR